MAKILISGIDNSFFDDLITETDKFIDCSSIEDRGNVEISKVSKNEFQLRISNTSINIVNNLITRIDDNTKFNCYGGLWQQNPSIIQLGIVLKNPKKDDIIYF